MAGKTTATEEQKRYAAVLDIGMKVGLLALVIVFIIYLTGVLSPHTPVDKVSDYWGLKVHDSGNTTGYLTAAGVGSGWSWLGRLSEGDFLNFAPIAFLAGVTVICYGAIIPILFKKKDSTFAVLALLEIAVLVLAASGVLPSGGH